MDIVFIEKGALKTNSMVLANLFDRPHRNVLVSLRSLVAEGYIGELEILLTSYTDIQGKEHPMYELTERGFLFAVPFIGGIKSKKGQLALVDAFLQMRQLLEDHHGQLQKELQDFALECRYSKERASVAGKALRKRREDIALLTARKVELEAKYQYQLCFGE